MCFLLTGDYGLTAKTIAEEIGLLTAPTDDLETSTDSDIEEGHRQRRVVEGTELEVMTGEALSEVLDTKELVLRESRHRRNCRS